MQPNRSGDVTDTRAEIANASSYPMLRLAVQQRVSLDTVISHGLASNRAYTNSFTHSHTQIPTLKESLTLSHNHTTGPNRARKHWRWLVQTLSIERGGV